MRVTINMGPASYADSLSEYGIGPDRQREILQAQRIWLATEFDQVCRTVAWLVQDASQHQLDLFLPSWSLALAHSWLEQSQPFAPLTPEERQVPREKRGLDSALPPEASQPWFNVPDNQRRQVQGERRYWSEVQPAYCCGSLPQFLADAETYHQALDYGSADALIREALKISPAWLRMAVAYLRFSEMQALVPQTPFNPKQYAADLTEFLGNRRALQVMGAFELPDSPFDD